MRDLNEGSPDAGDASGLPALKIVYGSLKPLFIEIGISIDERNYRRVR
jgi:hypothetical protein